MLKLSFRMTHDLMRPQIEQISRVTWFETESFKNLQRYSIGAQNTFFKNLDYRKSVEKIRENKSIFKTLKTIGEFSKL